MSVFLCGYVSLKVNRRARGWDAIRSVPAMEKSLLYAGRLILIHRKNSMSCIEMKDIRKRRKGSVTRP